MNFVVKKSLVGRLLIHIYLILLFIYNVFFNVNIILVLLGIIGSILFFLYINDFFYYLNNRIIFFLIFYLLVFGYATNLFYSFTLGRVAVVLQILTSIGIAIFFIKEYISEKIFLIYFFLFFIFVCYKILYIKLNVNNIFQHGGSRNTISIVALIYTVQYYFLAIRNKVTIKLYPSIFCLFLCIVGIGRTGIFVSFCLFLYILIKNAEFSKFYRIIVFLLIIICSFIFSRYRKTMLSIFDLYNIIKESDIGHKGLLYSERFSLWREYIVNLEWFEWLIGKNISHYRGRIFLRLNGNLHSSFFQMHARCGLGGLMFSIYILMIMLKRKKSYRVKMFSVLLFAILIRGFFDIIFFFTPNDFVVMALLFSLVVEKNSKYKFNILKYDTERHNKHERQL